MQREAEILSIFLLGSCVARRLEFGQFLEIFQWLAWHEFGRSLRLLTPALLPMQAHRGKKLQTSHEIVDFVNVSLVFHIFQVRFKF